MMKMEIEVCTIIRIRFVFIHLSIDKKVATSNLKSSVQLNVPLYFFFIFIQLFRDFCLLRFYLTLYYN